MTPQADGSTPIEAVAYQPSAQQQRRSRFTLWHGLLGLLAGAALVALWFMLTSRSVTLAFVPTDAAVTNIKIQAPLQLQLGDVYLLRPGEYTLGASAPGFEPISQRLKVSENRNQRIELAMQPLPGQISINSEPSGARVYLEPPKRSVIETPRPTPNNSATTSDATTANSPRLLGTTPLTDLSIPAGSWQLRFDAPSYQTQQLALTVAGRTQHQSVATTLLPDWADVTITSKPAGARIYIDDKATEYVTPAVVPVPSGEHELRVKTDGHRSFRKRLLLTARAPITLEPITLARADALLQIATTPSGAGITVNGKFRGEAPLELALKSGTNYRIRAFRAGFASNQKQVRLKPGEEQNLRLPLSRLTGQLTVAVQPANAKVYVDGKLRGEGNKTFTLPSRTHTVEVKLAGYAGYRKTLTPKTGVPQELKVKLLTIADARIAALKPTITTKLGQELVLLKPDGQLQMGASRREPGRRANETLRKVTLKRLFYLATKEVTNAQYQAFTANHDSGEFQDQNLSKPNLPVADITWQDAAMYCNWLSKQEGLTPFYRFDVGTLAGWNTAATGYRLPTEAEWAFAARQIDDAGNRVRFPWGAKLPPPDRFGNFADRSAAHVVGRIIFGYNDNYIAAAPAGSFPAGQFGLFDLAGNVAEWVHDYYEIPSTEAVTDPLGPSAGEYHVIKGSSWMHGTVTDLRLTFRDYAADGRQDLGFRLARFAEDQ